MLLFRFLTTIPRARFAFKVLKQFDFKARMYTQYFKNVFNLYNKLFYDDLYLYSI